ncbi:hypothetical protein [Bremerella sp. P1]|uniref:hypothetical protein n=1 Tax=Bremerella sp. P1 TaxID=3026424 RepID=UPI0023687112|nr:hypothetical protein [Bremerella sp. P1]WDI40471.1 hypothetical protein PSR63_18505 [Bremerella sp. P1]
MAKRDPNKTARNRIIAAIKEKLRSLLPRVLKDTGYSSEASLNATIGSKHDDFFDLKHDVVPSHEQFVMHWMEGFVKAAKTQHSCREMMRHLKKSKAFKEYLLLFLKRSYLKHYEELAKHRPHVSEAILWIGQTNANYGLAVTPRFKDGQWENDKSEIRAFRNGYWTIGHVMETGLVIPGKKKIFEFSDVDQYLLFFTDTLVRNSGSTHEYELAELYADFVKQQEDPNSVPLLIPEYRYGGLHKQHRYRLDFLIINPFTLDKVGFELSPWSTHGYLRKIKGLTQAKINEMAKDNFEKEMEKHRTFFQDKGIYSVIYTDKNLKDKKKLFEKDFVPLLQPERPTSFVSFEIMEEFLE